MDKQKLVLIGNGMAGVRCIEEILKHSPYSFEITIFGSEPHPNYNRIQLSAVLQGGTSFKDITINDRDWYNQQNIKLFTGETVIKIDTEKQLVKTDKNQEVPYDRLIIATGSVPFQLPLPGVDKEGVITFRTMEDCQKMIETAKHYKKAVVIGGGVLGLEAAKGLLNLDMEVTVVHNCLNLMERQLDETAAKLLETELEKQGFHFLFEKETKEILGSKRVEGVSFKDGTEAEADLVVMAVGVRPNIQLAKESGIETNRAILVNDYMETNIPNIYAVGECVEHRGIVYGLVKPLYDQGKVLAQRICGLECKGYEGTVLSTQLKISGVDVFSVGQFMNDESLKSIEIYDELDGVYKKLVFEDSKMVGAVLFGDTSDRTRLLDMILKKQDVSDVEKVTLFQASSGGGDTVASMAHSEIICNCNGVPKGAIIEAVLKNGLTTVDEIKKCTKASGSCGGCKPLVTDLLTYIQSDEFDEVIEQKSMCPCTSLTEDEVVYEMQLQSCTTVQEVMEVLDWESKEGCTTCRPALAYYLGMIYPEYESRQESLFVSEQMNAIVQQDGTYTVVPQMYGGKTTAEQLRTIADVAEKYSISNVAVTSEQRIHLMGVKKEDLASVWADLNMAVSSTYGNMVQNIKTSIGEHICRCDKQSSIQLAVSLEKKLEFLTTPYRVKMGISACMHNGAGSTTKDIGVIGTGLGWEIYVGGSSGRNVRAGELLCLESLNHDVIEIICAFIQYYRETANFLERTWQWIERVGLVHVREILFDLEHRQQLLLRLEKDRFLRKKLLVKSSRSSTVL
ncbi:MULTISPECIES: nitrite reductase large subunit NirB [unclassified Bacillus (in: firmicutes)]|uniref:nitrite reductase large subunit NirB n=1 Tax=unclassified Bacillus (in: firmicutes) TaxID=185979 RepID=UPI001BE6A5E1|nr:MULTISPECIES: nitrite reductase large subunit NirB [unclassified Bacillus (in: firmicutes)]MBT2725050.1 NAD(P)/FAD-dependent oxidoreductase [Bacillus sp. ISL-46]MBT2743430.1 NAD(P)/FAD-dependent oxidoreductase [Bacillus sp. ISL-77]